MKKLMTIVVLGTIMVATGCATQTGLIQPTQQTTPSSSESQKFYIAGIGQEKTVDAAAACGGSNNVAKVQTMQTGTEILLSVITFGIYTPRTAQVYCK